MINKCCGDVIFVVLLVYILKSERFYSIQVSIALRNDKIKLMLNENCVNLYLQLHLPRRPLHQEINSRRNNPNLSQNIESFHGFIIGPLVIVMIFQGFLEILTCIVYLFIYYLLCFRSNTFFKRISDDLAVYASHAHRQTIEPADVELLMRR